MAQSTASRRIKRPAILILLVLASLGLVVVELRSPNRVSSAGRWTVAVFSPFFQGGRWASDRLREGALQIIQTQTTRLENQRLKEDNGSLALTVSSQRELIAKLERERSSELPKLPHTVLSPLYGNVIGISQQPWNQTLMIDRGELDGVREAMPVVDFSGAVVGIVAETSGREATVRLITDPGFMMGAMIEDNASRDQGLLSGLGETREDNDKAKKSNYVVRFRPNEPQKTLQVGMQVISTGFKNSLYPKGLRIGRIVRFNKDKYGTDFAYVAPDAKFSSLEEVIIIDSESVNSKTAAAGNTSDAVQEGAADANSQPATHPVLAPEEDPEAERGDAASQPESAPAATAATETPRAAAEEPAQ